MAFSSLELKKIVSKCPSDFSPILSRMLSLWYCTLNSCPFLSGKFKELDEILKSEESDRNAMCFSLTFLSKPTFKSILNDGKVDKHAKNNINIDRNTR